MAEQQQLKVQETYRRNPFFAMMIGMIFFDFTIVSERKKGFSPSAVQFFKERHLAETSAYP